MSDLVGIDVLRGMSRPFQKVAVPGVYFLFKGDDLIYVGQSIDVFSRVYGNHRLHGEFDSWAYLMCDVCELDEVERRYISAFSPCKNFNKKGRLILPPVGSIKKFKRKISHE